MKNHEKLLSALLFVEFPQVQCIDLREIVDVMKDDMIVISNIVTVVSHVLSAKVSPNGG